MAVRSLSRNGIGPEGAAAISGGLSSVPQLETLTYVAVGGVCVRTSNLLFPFCVLRGAAAAMRRLWGNRAGPGGAAAIACGLACVPQLLTLEYVCVSAVCKSGRVLASSWGGGTGDASLAMACGARCEGMGGCASLSTALHVFVRGCFAIRVRVAVMAPRDHVKPRLEWHRADGGGHHQRRPGQCASAASVVVRGCLLCVCE